MSRLFHLAKIGSVAFVVALASRTASANPTASPDVVSAECDVIDSLTNLSTAQRGVLSKACTDKPSPSAETYTAMFRLVSSPGWHAGVIETILRRASIDSFTAWASGGAGRSPELERVQQTLISAAPEFAARSRCAELQSSAAFAEFIDAIDVDDEPEIVPFNSRFAACMGVPDAQLEGVRLLSVRADSLADVTVVTGTREYVHARRFRRADALTIEGHRFIVIAVPDASPAVVFANHENQRMPVVWRGLVNRNLLIWGAPPRRSCLNLSAKVNEGTQLFIDGVRMGGGDAVSVCAAESSNEVLSIDRTLTVTLDHPDSGLPDHEIAALTCEDGAAVVRHLSAVPGTVPRNELRAAGDCESLSLDLSAPAEHRVAVLGVTKMPGCEATPMWASDIPERVRNILGGDISHEPRPGRNGQHERDRVYANFSAYAEASEALGALESRLGRRSESRPDKDDDNAHMLLGSAAQEAWRQGIDTLLSFAVQCTERGQTNDGRSQWAYSIRATSIKVSGLFARGYYGREGLDLKEFIDVHSVAFRDARQQDAAVGTLLDQVFQEEGPRFMTPTLPADHRRPQVVRVSRYHHDDKSAPPERQTVDYVAVDGRAYCNLEGTKDDPACRPDRFFHAESLRPSVCEALVHRGTRSRRAINEADEVFRQLYEQQTKRTQERNHKSLQRSRGEYDASDDAHSAAYQGPLEHRWPGWYLAVVRDEEDEVVDAVCVHATTVPSEVWGEVAFSGRPVAFATNGSRIQFYTRPRLGATWYSRPGWFGGGVSLGYGFSGYAGARGDWRDLEVSVQERQLWFRHAFVSGTHAEFRTRLSRSPVQLWARLDALADLGFVAIERVDDALIGFRAGQSDDVVLDFDIDLGVQLGFGVPVGPVSLRGFVMGNYMAVDDSLARSATSVTEDANLLFGAGFGVSGGRR